jgi:hypothetical protein
MNLTNNIGKFMCLFSRLTAARSSSSLWTKTNFKGEFSVGSVRTDIFFCAVCPEFCRRITDLQCGWIPSDSRMQSQDVRPWRHAGGSPVRSWVPAGWPFTYSTSVMVVTCSAELVAEHD